MRTLGVVLAGGQSRRFGSDKAEALLHGRTLLNHAIAALAPHCDEVAVVGRHLPALLSIDDWPGPGLGPLGGLAGALRYARDHEFTQVLSVPVDAALLPSNLRALLEPAPSFVESQPVIGLWPVSTSETVEAIVAGPGSHAVRALADRLGARPVTGVIAPTNINTRDELDALAAALRKP